MKLRAVFNKRREVLELKGDALTLGNCREAVCRKFGFRLETKLSGNVRQMFKVMMLQKFQAKNTGRKMFFNFENKKKLVQLTNNYLDGILSSA